MVKGSKPESRSTIAASSVQHAPVSLSANGTGIMLDCSNRDNTPRHRQRDPTALSSMT